MRMGVLHHLKVYFCVCTHARACHDVRTFWRSKRSCVESTEYDCSGLHCMLAISKVWIGCG